MSTNDYSTVRGTSIPSRIKTKAETSMVSQEAVVSDKDLMARKIAQVDQFLNGLDEQDLKVLKQRILINQSNSEKAV